MDLAENLVDVEGEGLNASAVVDLLLGMGGLGLLLSNGGLGLAGGGGLLGGHWNGGWGVGRRFDGDFSVYLIRKNGDRVYK